MKTGINQRYSTDADKEAYLTQGKHEALLFYTTKISDLGVNSNWNLVDFW